MDAIDLATKRKQQKTFTSRFRDRLRRLIKRNPSVAATAIPSAPHAKIEKSTAIRSLDQGSIASIRDQLAVIVSKSEISNSEREDRLEWIGQQVLQNSRVMDSGNFQSVDTVDLIFMSNLYEKLFFNDLALNLARQDGLTFRWSSRMTSAGGKTTRLSWPATATQPARCRYEIAISSSLLFQTFHDHTRQIRVCGRVCNNRLEAMQRIVEHELIHLVEMLVWTDSNCAASRFQGIVHRLFGHTEHRHELITQRERAYAKFDIRPGTKVQFDFEGQKYVGVVNRITRRATVLVESPRGTPFTDGKRYVKYYIPLSLLEPIK